MKRSPTFALLTVLLFAFSCFPESSNPLEPTELAVVSFKDTVRVFCNSGKNVILDLVSPVAGDDQPILEQNEYPYFYAGGIAFAGSNKKALALNIYGYQVTPGPITSSLVVHIGSRTASVPLCVHVQDFYYANTFETNVVNDTVKLRKGTDFVLQITCRDTANRVVPRIQLWHLMGTSWYFQKNYTGDKILATGFEKDTTSFHFLLSALPDATPGPEDVGTRFVFQLSNKKLTVPIVLTD